MALDFEMDWDRERRTGIPEAVLCSHKSAAQIAAILTAARAEKRRLLLTRLDQTVFEALRSEVRFGLDYDPLSRTAMEGGTISLSRCGIGIVVAGTSDMPMAREAVRTLAFSGHDAALIADVGVTGLWRLMARIEEIRRFNVIIAVAGMEGALFTVLAGLVRAPVIALPTSVGYGVASAGNAALVSALASCAPGVVVVNTDNGFGAATAAIKIMLAAHDPLAESGLPPEKWPSLK